MTIRAPYTIHAARVGDVVGTDAPLTCCGRTMMTYQRPSEASTHGCVSCGSTASVDDTGRVTSIRVTCCGRTMMTYQRPSEASTHGCVSCGSTARVGDTGRVTSIRG